MTDQPSWAIAAQAEIAVQLGRLTIDNATLRAQSSAVIADNQKKDAEITRLTDALDKAQKELAEKNPPETPPAVK